MPNKKFNARKKYEIIYVQCDNKDNAYDVIRNIRVCKGIIDDEYIDLCELNQMIKDGVHNENCSCDIVTIYYVSQIPFEQRSSENDSNDLLEIFTHVLDLIPCSHCKQKFDAA